jgi:hypothetical protein
MERTNRVWQTNNLRNKTSNSEENSRSLISPPLFILIFFSLFDFYKSGFRVFDVVAIAFIAICILIYRKFNPLSAGSVVTLLGAGVFALIGIFSNNNYPSIFALLVNYFLFHILSLKEFKPSQKQIKLVILLHLFFFFLQFSYFYATKEIINYHTFTDITPRLESSIFRPAGFFYEPAIYCFAMFILTTMLDSRNSKYGMIESLVMVTMVLSVSLLGFAFAAFILIRLVSEKKFGALIFCVFLVIFAKGELIESILTFVKNRIFDLDEDGSAEGRYGDILNLFSNENLIYHLFGRGFGANFEQFGSSGASAAISAVGIFGVSLFSGWLLLRSRVLLVGILSLVVIMISAPIFSYGIFPYWIANIIRNPGRVGKVMDKNKFKKNNIY